MTWKVVRDDPDEKNGTNRPRRNDLVRDGFGASSPGTMKCIIHGAKCAITKVASILECMRKSALFYKYFTMSFLIIGVNTNVVMKHTY